MSQDPMAGERFIRTVGRRVHPSSAAGATAPGQGAPPSLEARAAMAQMAQYRTRVPKGVFIYASHADANRDWERWRTEAMLERSRVQAQ